MVMQVEYCFAVLAMLEKVDYLLIAKSIAINYLRIRHNCALPSVGY